MTPTTARSKLLQTALRIIRTKGYAATTVDGLCDEAGVSKGSFFHYFKNKEELAIEAAAHFAGMAEGLFSDAPFTQLPDPFERVIGYLEFRRSILAGDLPDYTCLLGTMVQETYTSHPSIRDACERHLRAHALERTHDIQLAKERYNPHAAWDPESLAFHIQAVLQGAFILAKASGGPQIVDDCIAHLITYIHYLCRKTV